MIPQPTGTERSVHHSTPDFTNYAEIDAFRHRQAADLHRRQRVSTDVQRRQAFDKRFRSVESSGNWDQEKYAYEEHEAENGEDGEEGWRNVDGERLKDFGVDEETEFYDEDNLPLFQLMTQKI